MCMNSIKSEAFLQLHNCSGVLTENYIREFTTIFIFLSIFFVLPTIKFFTKKQILSYVKENEMIRPFSQYQFYLACFQFVYQ